MGDYLPVVRTLVLIGGGIGIRTLVLLEVGCELRHTFKSVGVSCGQGRAFPIYPELSELGLKVVESSTIPRVGGICDALHNSHAQL